MAGMAADETQRSRRSMKSSGATVVMIVKYENKRGGRSVDT